MFWNNSERTAYRELRRLERAMRYFPQEDIARRQQEIIKSFSEAQIQVAGDLAERIEQAGITANFISAHQALAGLEGRGLFGSRGVFTSQEEKDKSNLELRAQFAAGGVRLIGDERKLPELLETRITEAYRQARVVPWQLAVLAMQV